MTAKTEDAFTADQIRMLKEVVCPGLTDAEVLLVEEAYRNWRLSPFTRQLHVTKRDKWDADEGRMVPGKVTIQVGIDGYRSRAEATGEYEGQGPAEWCGPDGAWTDVWLDARPPAAARATVYRRGRKPSVSVARYAAYVQTKKGGNPNGMWAKMGPEQLAKCAESLALRKAFPEQLSGVYTTDEMAQADSESPFQPPAAARSPEPEKPKLAPPPPPEPERPKPSKKVAQEMMDEHFRKQGKRVEPPASDIPPPPPMASPVDSPEGPRFPKVKWTHAVDFGDRLMSDAPTDVLKDFLEDIEVWLRSDLSPKKRIEVEAVKTSAYAALIDVEARAAGVFPPPPQTEHETFQPHDLGAPMEENKP